MTGPTTLTPPVRDRSGLAPRDGVDVGTPDDARRHATFGWDMTKLDWSVVEREARDAWRDAGIPEGVIQIRLQDLRQIHDACHCFGGDRATRDRLYRSFADNNFRALHALNTINNADNVQEQGNNLELKRELITQTVLWMHRDSNNVAINLTQGRGPHCYAAVVLGQMSPSELAVTVSDLATRGETSIVRDGRSVAVLRYDHATFRDRFEPETIQGRGAYSGSAGINFMRAIAAWDVAAGMQKLGASPEEWMSLAAHVSGRRVIGVGCGPEAGPVLLDAAGNPLTPDRPGGLATDPWDFFTASVADPRNRVIAQVEWDRHGAHLHHVVEVVRTETRYSTVTGRTEVCYLIRNPLGVPLAPNGKPLEAGRVVHSGRMAYEVAPGNNGYAYVPASVMQDNLRYFAVVTPESGGPAGRLTMANRVDTSQSRPAIDTDFEIRDDGDGLAYRSRPVSPSPVMQQVLDYGAPVVGTDKRGDSDDAPTRARGRTAMDRDPFRPKTYFELVKEEELLAAAAAAKSPPKEETLKRPSTFVVDSVGVTEALKQGYGHMAQQHYGPAGSGAVEVRRSGVGGSAFDYGLGKGAGTKIVDPSNKA